MTSSRLPAALAPWAAALSAVSPELAVALGPLLLRLDRLVGDHESVVDTIGEPDGVGGLARTGRPDQLLPSEWLLADEFPDEFLRRLADGELLHLATEFRSPAGRGRIAALVDAGPTQAGAGRLVQLAALLVLHRRAAARGTELVVGVLGDPSGRWLTGGLAELLPTWLAARRSADPTPEDVQRARAALDDADQAWLLTSPRLADRLPAHPRTLTAEPARWTADGADRVLVRLAGGTAELPLPAGDIAVRALRGAEFRRPGPAAGRRGRPRAAADRALPAFPNGARTLIARGAEPSTLLAVNLPHADGRRTVGVRARRHDLAGPVLAAGRIARRLVALQVRGDRLVPHVVGRPFGEPGGYTVDLADLDTDPDAVAEHFARPVLPLLREGDDLLLPLSGRWWRIAPDGTATPDGEAGRGTHDREQFNPFREPRLFTMLMPLPQAVGSRHFLHGNGAQAWSDDGRSWHVMDQLGEESRISFQEQADVIGLVSGRQPALITCSRDGRTVRSVRADGVRTLSRFSGGLGPVAVHPSEPLIAVEKEAGLILIGDANTGRIDFQFWSAE
ncbi:hypothetical protein [Kitasatospora sp. A2-31]|uniref:hypothetical protein n=1 Tax=Kitasatospora sp. A2-31 TaxID=2916414 RepID=UPI001EEC321F|nr:hypothetical protein [Kitasatospora sp. A2-31]MCG6497723.1 hypothetical protein [Kitasatospora sp. A2-31]